LVTTPSAFPASMTRSNILFPNGSNRPCVFRLAPYLVIPNSPEHNHKEDQDSPVEVFGIGVWRNGEEHEDEQRGLEGEGSELGRAEVSKRVGGRFNAGQARKSRQLTLNCRRDRSACPGESAKAASARRRNGAIPCNQCTACSWHKERSYKANQE
jgi:hypothetical protein